MAPKKVENDPDGGHAGGKINHALNILDFRITNNAPIGFVIDCKKEGNTRIDQECALEGK
jgi:hypothetical protein